MAMLIPGKADGQQQQFSGLLGVKHVFKSRANAEHEEEQSIPGKQAIGRAALKRGWVWITQPLLLQRTL